MAIAAFIASNVNADLGRTRLLLVRTCGAQSCEHRTCAHTEATCSTRNAKIPPLATPRAMRATSLGRDLEEIGILQKACSLRRMCVVVLFFASCPHVRCSIVRAPHVRTHRSDTFDAEREDSAPWRCRERCLRYYSGAISFLITVCRMRSLRRTFSLFFAPCPHVRCSIVRAPHVRTHRSDTFDAEREDPPPRDAASDAREVSRAGSCV